MLREMRSQVGVRKRRGARAENAARAKRVRTRYVGGSSVRVLWQRGGRPQQQAVPGSRGVMVCRRVSETAVEEKGRSNKQAVKNNRWHR